MSNRDRAVQLWHEAKTLRQLGELTAQWLEGTLPSCPFYGGDADPETKPLVKFLAGFNRRGLVTICSQPAEALDERGSGQRACLEGYAQEEVAKQLAALGLYSDLLVLIYPPGVAGGYQIPVTVWEYHPYTWLGASWGGQEELSALDEDLSKEGLEALATAWKVVIIDLQWGRDYYLWEHVRDALVSGHDKPFTVSPSPDLGLKGNFVF